MGTAISNMLGAGEGNESEHSGVTKLSSSAQWQLHFKGMKDSNQLLVIDFSASWCGPCKSFEPAVRHMAVKFTDVSFVKVDVDELPEVAKEFDVTAMPTFVLMKNGKEVDRIVGAKQDELENKRLVWLKRMNRLHIHFSCGVPTDGEVISGMRRDVNVLIFLNIKKALEGV
ncbi:hypothetical protein YC2023_047839 [Brassica napus]